MALPVKGFIQLYIGAAIAIAIAAIGIVWKAYSLGVEHTEARLNAATAAEKAARVQMISDLALELGARSQADQEARVKRDSEVMAQRSERDAQLKNYVPQVAGSDTCIRAGWVRYTNAAAAGMPLGLRPLPGIAEAPAGVGTDSVAGTVAKNYDKYHDCKARVADILKEFDGKRAAQNSVIDRINQRVERAERKVR